jgi:hypothetical protein
MDTAALVDRMVDCFNRHDPEALAACHAPDARVETLPATGRATDIAGVVVLEVAGGRVTAERHYWPLADGLVQLGLIGPSGHAVGRHPAHEASH